ncbi:MAG: hypothetical protein ACE14M_14475 [Terriglobales bacterium]
MARDPVAELADFTAVHSFYIALLQQRLGHPVPVPAGLSQASAVASGDRLAVALNILRRWLNVLDLAVSPSMLRNAVREPSGKKALEPLLRYYALKPKHTQGDQDRCDVVVTALYRERTSSDVRMNAGARGINEEGPEFEKEIGRILNTEGALLPDEHRQLAHEFQFIRQEVEDFRDFDKLMDSGILDRVRDIKQRFGPSFYHPRVLASVAEHNAFFGQRFDELFREAIRQIKAFAGKVQQEGGSLLSRVEGDIVVKHLTEVEEGSILQQEYGRAKSQFHKVSRYKKAVDRRNRRKEPAVSRPPVPPRAPQMPANAFNGSDAPKLDISSLAEMPGRALATTLEDGKLQSMEDSIRNFVRAADSKSGNIVPMRTGNIALTSAEVEAFRSDFSGERSFRAEFAAVHRQIVAVQARILTELEEFRTKQDSAYLWKPHADSLAYLLNVGQRLLESSAPVIATANQRGLTEKVTAMNASLQKLRWELQRSAKTLETLAPPPQRTPHW